MNFVREDLLRALEAKGYSGPDARIILEAVLDVVKAKLVEGDGLALKGFGTFVKKLRKGHPARNPKTGEVIPVPDHFKITFKPSQWLRRSINDARS